MMIPIKYSIRSLVARRMTTALTVLGVAMVIFVFAAVLMLADGLKKTLVASGSDDNAIVIRQSSSTEIQSFVTRYQAGVIQTLPDIALDQSDQPLVTGEVTVLIDLTKISNHQAGNVMVRGIQEKSL